MTDQSFAPYGVAISVRRGVSVSDITGNDTETFAEFIERKYGLADTHSGKRFSKTRTLVVVTTEEEFDKLKFDLGRQCHIYQNGAGELLATA